MVQGRMNRELNPIPNRIPGYTPQYKEDDGTFTDVTPNTPYPTKDKDVKEELEAVKAELEAIKNGTLKTEVTGSNVELVAENTNIGLIPAGTALSVLSDLDLSQYSYFIVQFRPGSGNNNYTIKYRPSRGNDNTPITEIAIKEVAGSASNMTTKKEPNLAIRSTFFVQNDMNNDAEFNAIHVLGVRR